MAPTASAMTRLRTLFLTQTYPRWDHDTAGPFIREIARGLVRLGDEVKVLVPHIEGLASSWDDDGVAVESFRYAPVAMEQVGYSRSLHRDERLRVAPAVAAPLYALGARRAVGRALDSGSWDVVHAHWIVPNGVAVAGLVSRRSTVPCLAYGLHGSDVFLAEKPGVRWWVERSLAKAQVVTGCSPELVDRILALGDIDHGRGEGVVIPYGIDSSDFSPGPDERGWRDRWGVSQDAVVILGVGRMATKKGFQVLLEVVDELIAADGRVVVVLAGGGDREAEFIERTRHLKGQVLFPGLVERDALPDLFRAADIFCLPAVHDEAGNVDGLPNVILEAMASGLPVVSTAVSGIPQAVRPGETGALCAEGDPRELLAALKLFVTDEEHRKHCGAAGRRLVEKEFTWDQVARRYRRSYTDAIARRRTTNTR